jgi:hypothetical protein
VALGLIFPGESISELRNLEFHQWHLPWLYLCFSHIAGQFDLTKSDHLKSHWGLFSQENPNLNSEIWNSISGTFHGYICVSATLQDNLTSPY